SYCQFSPLSRSSPSIYSLPLHDALPISSFLCWSVKPMERYLFGRFGDSGPVGFRVVFGAAHRCFLAHLAGDGEPDVDRHEHAARSEEHTSELQSRENLVCRLLREKKKRI